MTPADAPPPSKTGPDGYRRRLWTVAGAVLVLNAVAWGTYWVGAASSGGAVVAAGVLAFGLGARHAFDADHIAVIDDCTRLASSQGKRRAGMGLSFALGHSSVVVLLTLGVLLWAGSQGASTVDSGRPSLALAATGFATLCLLAVGALNARVGWGLLKLRRDAAAAPSDDTRMRELLASRSLMARVLGNRGSAWFTSSWKLYPVGFVFGLGMETASEVALLAVSAKAAVSGMASLASLIALPLLFAAGMTLFDTVNSALVVNLYSGTSGGAGADRRRLNVNTGLTVVTAGVGLVIGSVYLAATLRQLGLLPGLDGFASWTDHFEVVGYVVVGAYAAVWILSLVWLRSPAEPSDLLPASEAGSVAAAPSR